MGLRANEQMLPSIAFWRSAAAPKPFSRYINRRQCTVASEFDSGSVNAGRSRSLHIPRLFPLAMAAAGIRAFLSSCRSPARSLARSRASFRSLSASSKLSFACISADLVLLRTERVTEAAVELASSETAHGTVSAFASSAFDKGSIRARAISRTCLASLKSMSLSQRSQQ